MPIAAGLFYFGNGEDQVVRAPTVLIHGAGGHHLFWPPQVRRLPDRRIYAPDLTGHGKSPGLGHHTIADYSTIVLEFLDALGLTTIVLVGHSMGGAIALDIATRVPRRVLGLALIGSGAKLRVAPELLRSTSDPATYAASIKRITELSFAPGTDLRLKQIAAQRLAETRPPVLHGDLVACDAFDVRDKLAGLAVPTLIICGEVDRMTPPTYSAYLQQHIPEAQLELVPGAGHMVMLEKPDVIAELLGRFLDAIPYRPGK